MKREYVETWRYPLSHGMDVEVRFIGVPGQLPSGSQVKHLIEYMKLASETIGDRPEPETSTRPAETSFRFPLG